MCSCTGSATGWPPSHPKWTLTCCAPSAISWRESAVSSAACARTSVATQGALPGRAPQTKRWILVAFDDIGPLGPDRHDEPSFPQQLGGVPCGTEGNAVSAGEIQFGGQRLVRAQLSSVDAAGEVARHRLVEVARGFAVDKVLDHATEGIIEATSCPLRLAVGRLTA